MDNLRHQYEAGKEIADLAYWHSTNRDQMSRWLAIAGTKFRKVYKKKRKK